MSEHKSIPPPLPERPAVAIPFATIDRVALGRGWWSVLKVYGLVIMILGGIWLGCIIFDIYDGIYGRGGIDVLLILPLVALGRFAVMMLGPVLYVLGVKFGRDYVCSACGYSVQSNAKSCATCGVSFVSKR